MLWLGLSLLGCTWLIAVVPAKFLAVLLITLPSPCVLQTVAPVWDSSSWPSLTLELCLPQMLKSSRQLGSHPCLFPCPCVCCLGSSLGALCNLKLHPQLSHREPRLTCPPVVPLGWNLALLPPATLKLAASDCLPDGWRSVAPQCTELTHSPTEHTKPASPSGWNHRAERTWPGTFQALQGSQK